MGVPIDKLICASNDNKVLYDFFKTGVYDKNRPFILTSSPSMDILISSNLERLIYLSTGCDAEETKKRMEELSKDGKYSVTGEMRARMAGFCRRLCRSGGRMQPRSSVSTMRPVI